MFIGEGASDQDISSQSHFEAYPQVREILIAMCEKFGLTYTFINLTMCNTRGASTPAKLKQSIQACSGIYSELANTFKSRINVLFGESVKNSFGIKGGRVAKLHGQVIGNNLVSIAVDKFTDKTQNVMIVEFANILKKTKFEKSDMEVAPSEELQGRIVGRITPDLTLFDVKEINSKILYILVNKQGEKIYYIEDLQFPVYLKSGSMSECEYIEEYKPEETITLNKHELQALKKMLRENMRKHLRG